MSRPFSSLKTLLRLAGVGPVRWLAHADRAAETVVHWVVKDSSSGGPGDLWLLSAEGWTTKLHEVVSRRGLAAVVLVGVPDAPEQFADGAAPMACLPEAEDLEAVHRKLLTGLVNQRAHLMSWGSDIQNRLDRLVAEGAGLSGLAQAMMDISGRGVIIQDKRLNVVASSASPSLKTIWEELLEELCEMEQLPEPLRDRKQAGKTPLALNQSLPGGLSRVVTSVNVGEVARGYLSLIGMEGDLDDLDHLVANQGALACAVQMSRSKAVRETEKRLQGDLLTALLKEELSPRDARLWVQAMGLDLTQAHVAMRFAWDALQPPSLRRLETLLNGEISRLDLAAIPNPMGSEVICFCQVSPQGAGPGPSVELAQNVAQRARQEGIQAPVRCGMGAPAADLPEWRTSFRQAGQALEMARRLQEEKPLYFPDLSVYRLLLQMENSPELKAFEQEILGPLLAYETGQELILTLEVYFEHNANLSQTADALFIHRNSLLYRMARIAEISGLDLDNPETRLAVQLALHIHRMFHQQ